MAFSVESDTFQIYLTSDGCLDKFPGNKPSNFRIALKTPKEFQNSNKKYSVGLARFGYDSALYNLGPNTGTFLQAFIEDKYFKIETTPAFAKDAHSAADILNKALDSLPSKLGISKNDFFNSRIFFYADAGDERIKLKLSNIDDFAISPMLRKLLGFHEESKLVSGSFEIRKSWRDFLREISGSESLLDDLENINHQIPRIERTDTFENRNAFRKNFKLNVEQFFHQLNFDLEPTLFTLVKDSKNEFDEFLQQSYYFSEVKKQSYSFFSAEEKRQIEIPFSNWSIIEFIIQTLAKTSVQILLGATFLFKPNTDFNPHLFNCLYVYTNLVKPVDYNDQQFRLLDIVFLKHSAGLQAGVVEHQSTHFKTLEIDRIHEIQIYVTTSLGFPAPFIHGPVFVVLEFRK